MTYDQADYFRVPLLNGRYGVGQILEVEDLPSGTIFCALTGKTTNATNAVQPLLTRNIVAFVMTTDAAITDGTWTLAGFDAIPVYRSACDYAHHKADGFSLLPTHAPAVIEGFMNAWHGQYPWDAFGPLFDQIKRTDIDKPAQAT